jgi:hypothetical protein
MDLGKAVRILEVWQCLYVEAQQSTNLFAAAAPEDK